MPRKKKEEEISNKIVNWYEKIPDELLDKTSNPNYHLHHLKIPILN
jgi:beta-glucosidase/6-phospho-beta-glucosidase/beta-galactosidase